MLTPEQLFDRSGRLRRPPIHRLAGEAWSFVSYHPAPPDPAGLPDGQGHAVLVVPAYCTNDAFSLPLRRFLDRCGFRSFGWELGFNWGPTAGLHEGLRRRFRQVRAVAGGPVSLVGISLGGMLARDLAFDFPDDVVQVVTLVSPINLPTASSLEPLVRLCLPFYSADIDPARLARPLPMPSTSIFTRDDGLVAWQSCRIDEPGATAIEVSGGHVSICRNPAALRAVVERLAAGLGPVAGQRREPLPANEA